MYKFGLHPVNGFALGGGCEILSQQVEPEGVCRFWIVPADPLAQVEPEAEALERRPRRAGAAAPRRSLSYLAAALARRV